MKHIHVQSCRSTFELLKENYDYENILVSCDKQTQGRGRGSNSWDFFEGSIAMSFNLKPTEVLTLTSIEMGVLICSFFKEELNIQLNLKWPNDIIKDDKKVGGLLIENFKDTYLLGIGLNSYLNNTEAFSENYKVKAGTIFKEKPNLNKKDLIASLCKFIHKNRIKNMNSITQQFDNLCFHKNKTVQIYDGDNIIGEFLGINTDGSAVIRSEFETKNIYSGSLRLLV